MPKNVSQSKDAKKWPTDANFQAPASTGRKKEIASTNAAVRYVVQGHTGMIRERSSQGFLILNPTSESLIYLFVYAFVYLFFHLKKCL